jgi:hypothetical protein
LIASVEGTISVLLGNGDGTFQTGPVSYTTIDGSSAFVAADMNADGIVDIVMTGDDAGPGYVGGVAVCLGNGDGTFQYGTFYPIADTGFDYLVVGDFNGDGIPDVATAGFSGVWLLTGKGDGTLNPGVLVASLPASDGKIATADFNGDGNLDIVVVQRSGGVNGSGAGTAVLLGNGNGTFQTAKTFPYPKQPSAGAAGPRTKGGPPGIALSDGSSPIYTSGTVRVTLPGRGRSIFPAPSASPSPISMATASPIWSTPTAISCSARARVTSARRSNTRSRAVRLLTTSR